MTEKGRLEEMRDTWSPQATESRIMGAIVQILYQILPVSLSRDQAGILGHLTRILGGHNLHGKWLQINVFSQARSVEWYQQEKSLNMEH
jgi:hypothetical protein